MPMPLVPWHLDDITGADDRRTDPFMMNNSLAGRHDKRLPINMTVPP